MKPLDHLFYSIRNYASSLLLSVLLCLWLQFANLGSPRSTLGTSETLNSPANLTSSPKGHLTLRPFGESGPRLLVEVRNEFPEPLTFFKGYVNNSKPLKLSGVMRDSRAFQLWTDTYLLALDVPENAVVHLETKKKENRSEKTMTMHFHEFLKIYNETEHYMVDEVPSYLRSDVLVPCSLQCPALMEKGFAYVLMWFSSGGTKSVIHTDAFDNINCLFRGEKSFVLVDPAKHRQKFELESEGAYSRIDVDSVDLHMYPALAEMEFYFVNVTAGDCLYIPYRWIHQVRSFNSNVAVNFWWDHHSSLKLFQKSEAACERLCDPNLTMDKVDLHGQQNSFDDVSNVRDWLRDIIINKPLNLHRFVEIIQKEYGSEELHPDAEETIIELFGKLDIDKDNQFTTTDNKLISDEAWTDIQEVIAALTNLMEMQISAEHEEYAAYVAADRREEL